MIRVYLDGFGDIELDGEEFITANIDSNYRALGIATDGCYDVDTSEFEGATPLYRQKGPWGFLIHYGSQGTVGAIVAFCESKLKQIFGEVPKEIWYKEV